MARNPSSTHLEALVVGRLVEVAMLVGEGKLAAEEGSLEEEGGPEGDSLVEERSPVLVEGAVVVVVVAAAAAAAEGR